MNIYGLEDFGLSESDLRKEYSDKKIDVEVHFNYHSVIESLKAYPVNQRRLRICQYLREQYKIVKTSFPSPIYLINGTPFKPMGISGQLTGQQLAALQSNQQIYGLIVKQVEGRRSLPKEAIPEPEAESLPNYFTVKGLFVAQFDDQETTGAELTEERMVLVKALNWDEAKQKARQEFEQYGQAEYFTSSAHFVKWKFLNILDIYDLGVRDIDPEGTEVYSIWKRRRLKESDYEENNPYT